MPITLFLQQKEPSPSVYQDLYLTLIFIFSSLPNEPTASLKTTFPRLLQTPKSRFGIMRSRHQSSSSFLLFKYPNSTRRWKVSFVHNRTSFNNDILVVHVSHGAILGNPPFDSSPIITFILCFKLELNGRCERVIILLLWSFISDRDLW